MVVGGIFLAESPFNPVQLLWINLIMDTFAALALATEPPSDELLDRQPVNRSEAIINPQMWRNIIFWAIFQLSMCFVVLFCSNSIFGLNYTLDMPVKIIPDKTQDDLDDHSEPKDPLAIFTDKT